MLRRVGVEEREGGFELDIICGLELGVEGLEASEGRGLSNEEREGEDRGFEGVEDLDGVVREGVEGLDVNEERVLGEDGLM